MQIKLNKRHFLCLMLLVICRSEAQTTLTMPEAIETALNKNIEIKTSENNLEISEKDKTTSYLELIPSLNYYGEAYKATGRTFDEVSGSVRTETGEFVTSVFRLNWNVLNISRNGARIKSAKTRASQSENDLESTKDETVLNVIASYIEILKNIKQDEIFESFYEVQERNLKRTEEMIKVGALPGQDYYTQKAELSRIKSMKLENLNEINNKKNELMQLLNIRLDSEVELVEIDSLVVENNQNIQELYGLALDNRFDLRSMESNVKNSKYQLRLERSAYYPSLSLFFNYGSNYSSFQSNDFQAQFFDDNLTQSYGLGMEIPIFNGGRQRNKVFNARKTFENSELELENFKNQIFTEISNTKGSSLVNIEKREYRKDAYEATKMGFQLEEERYYLGAGDPRDLANAQRDFIEASLLLNQINYQITFNKYEIQYYLGLIRR